MDAMKWASALVLALASGCSDGSSGAGGTPNGVVPDAAVAGTERAPCYPNGTCNAGLECSAESVCIAAVVAGVVCFGDFAISKSLDLEAFIEANCEQVTGTLSLSIERNEALTEFSLPLLASVGGSLSITKNAALTSISLPLLASVGSSLGITKNAALTSISLPLLASVGGDLSIRENAALTSISLPLLVSVGEDLTMRNNAALTSISLPALVSVGGDLFFGGNEALCDSIVGEIVSRVDVQGDVSVIGAREGC